MKTKCSNINYIYWPFTNTLYIKEEGWISGGLSFCTHGLQCTDILTWLMGSLTVQFSLPWFSWLFLVSGSSYITEHFPWKRMIWLWQINSVKQNKINLVTYFCETFSTHGFAFLSMPWISGSVPSCSSMYARILDATVNHTRNIHSTGLLAKTIKLYKIW